MGYINPTGKILRHVDRLALWQAGKPFAPIGVEIDLTNRCNLGCRDCHFAYTHTRGLLARKDDARYADMGDTMDIKLLDRVMGEMVEAGVKSVTFTGGGEPTLHPGFVSALGTVRKSMQCGLYTNATLIDPPTAQAIKKNCTWVVVSLDEMNAEKYRETKKVDAFDRACTGIRNLVNADGNAVVGVSFLLNHRNYDDARAMLVLGNELGADYTEFRPTIKFDEDKPARADEDTAWVGRALPILESLQRTPKCDARIEQFKLYKDYSRPYAACNGILFTGVITPNGHVWKCVNRRGFPDSFVGDLTQESFADVWAKQKPQTDFAKCRVLCRADVMNRQLWQLAQPLPHENFV